MMITFLEWTATVIAFFLPLLPFMYMLMLVVAEALITAVQNWNE